MIIDTAPWKQMLDVMGVEPNVSDEDYEKWKSWYDTIPEYEKIEHLLGAIAQYLSSGDRTSAVILATAIICTNRWTDAKSFEDF